MSCGLFFQLTPIEKKTAGKKGKNRLGFLKKQALTGFLQVLSCCQNAAEISVNGWLVTYFKGSGILSGTLSAYTVTVMWTATLIARLLIAFVFPPEKSIYSYDQNGRQLYFILHLPDNG